MRKSLHRQENLALIELLKNLRVRLNLRQVELAERLGVNQNFVSNVEQGIRRLDVVELRDYASALGSSFADVTAQWESLLGEGTDKPRKRRRATVDAMKPTAVHRRK
ncbi:MAG: helix-turn-helix transcriptional regulator [Proteobacteria bacterium]|nr:helix-turn-helix transcriptional regulator [Pseudomonadota bacterium]